MSARAFNPETGEVLEWDGQGWHQVYQASTTPAYGGQGALGSSPLLAFEQAGAQRLGRMGARLANFMLPGQPVPEPSLPEGLEDAFPAATAAGKALPYAVPVPGGIVAQGLAGAATGALAEDDPAAGAITGGLSGAAGHVAGQILGRVYGGIRGAASAVRRNIRPTTPGGLRQTIGQATGSRGVQMAEAAAARNFVTAGPFREIDEYNEHVVREEAKRFLGVPGARNLTEAMQRAFQDSVKAINEAVPETAVIPVPDELAAKFGVLRKTGEAFELPPEEALSLTGRQVRSLRSDLGRGTKSASALTRDRSREALALLDEAIAGAEGVNPELFAAGRRQYQRWATLDRGAALARSGPDIGEKLNPATALANLERSFGRGARTGGKAIPEDAARLRQVLGEYAGLTSPVPNSGTPTGQSLGLLGADLVTTGGVGTASAWAGAKLAEGPAGYGFFGGMMADPGQAGVYGAILAKILAREARE